jgi:hypothetical protein
MWTAIQYVTTPLSLIAFLVAVLAVVYRVRLKHKLAALKTVPEKERGALLEKSLETYSLTDDNLTRNQKYELLTRVLENRVRRMKIVAYSAVPVTVVAFVVAAVIFAANKPVPVVTPVVQEVTDDDFTFTFDPPSPLDLFASQTTITATLKDKSDKAVTVPLTWSLVDVTDAQYVEVSQQGNTITVRRQPAADKALLKDVELLVALSVQTTQPLSSRAQPSEQFNLVIRRHDTSEVPKVKLTATAEDGTRNSKGGGLIQARFELASFQRTSGAEPQVYIMDNRDRVYNPQTSANGGTNATDIREIIDEFRLSVHSVVETIYKGWAGEKQVTNADLIIIHYHCWQFSAAGDTGNWEQTLREFIGRIASEKPNVHFIIYSRIRSIDNTDRARGGYFLSWRYEDKLQVRGLHNRIHPLHIVRGSNEFCDQLTKGKLASLIKTILKVREQT